MNDHHHEEAHQRAEAPHSGAQAHVIEYGNYIFIWLGLLAFTGITVTASGINLGNWTIVIALMIASIKSYYVMNYFMHMKYEDNVFKTFLFTALLTFAIFLGFIFWDYSFTR